jgi:hypothetical protein
MAVIFGNFSLFREVVLNYEGMDMSTRDASVVGLKYIIGGDNRRRNAPKKIGRWPNREGQRYDMYFMDSCLLWV